MKRSILLLLALTGASFFGSAQTTFSYTGAQQFYVVPACVTEVEIAADGAQGNNAAVGGATGGLGGTAIGRLAVTPGDTLWVYVGGQNGYNGGGLGGQNGNTTFGGPAGTLAANGGGASDVRYGGTTLADRVIVAGGGGGAGENGVWPGCQVAGPSGNGGNGGDLTGSTGGFGVGFPCNCMGGGGDGATGGSQVAGGITGGYYGDVACLRTSWGPGENGSFGFGGNGSLLYHNGTGGGGGGGGGYYGGGAGGNGSDTTPGGGGGGGSSYLGTLTASSTTGGTNSGNGSVMITVTAQAGPSQPTGLSGASTACEGDTLTFTVNSQPNTVDYTWSLPNGGTVISGQGTTSITAVVGAGTGNVEVIANNSCASSTPAVLSITVNANPTLSLSASNMTPCVYYSSIQLTGTPAGGTWSGSGVTGATFDPATGVGMYDLMYEYTDGNSCTATDFITITVEECLGVEENISLNAISVFPNPATTEINVSFGMSLTGVEMHLIDAQGKLIYASKKQNIDEAGQLSIPVVDLPNGIYTLRVNSDLGTRTIVVSVAN